MQAEDSEDQIRGATNIASFVKALQPPRAIIIMIKARPPVDDVIAQLTPHLARSDLLSDDGNSFSVDRQRRL